MLAVKHAQSSTIFTMNRSNNDFFTCQYCADQFKREDHLRRHELSHRSPKFNCKHEGCGKSFHRNDVLKRHQLVHRPEPEKRKKSCRKRVAARGSTSRSPPISSSSQRGYNSEQTTSISRSPPAPTQLYATPVPWIQIGPFLGINDNAAMMNNLAISPWLTHNTYQELLEHTQQIPTTPVSLHFHVLRLKVC
jgi:Zinc finger, C2H2 type